MAEYPHGRFGWYELSTTDTRAAIAFYGGLTPWTAAPFPHELRYTIWRNGGSAVAGLMELTPEMRARGVGPNWLVHILTDDIEATVDQVRKLGGGVVVDVQPVPSVGRFAVARDPQGAVFALLHQDQPPGHDGEAKVGEFSWNELATTDWRTAWQFYQALFGWDAAGEMDMGELGVYKMFAQKGIPRGAIYNKPPDMPVPPHWLPYIKLADADLAAERVRNAGGQVLNGPMDVPDSGRITQCADPQGAMFAVHSETAVLATERAAQPRRERPAAQPSPASKKAAVKSSKRKAAKRVTKRPVKKTASARQVKKRVTRKKAR